MVAEVLILFFDKFQWILDITNLQKEIERQQSKKFHQTSPLEFLNKTKFVLITCFFIMAPFLISPALFWVQIV